MRADDEPTIEGPGRARERRSGARFLPGTMLDGRYRIVAPLGHGGMGEVFALLLVRAGLVGT